jgi:hypothetical protein
MQFELPRRFEEKIIPEPNSGCWLWLGALDGKGYGQAKIIGTRRQAQVHRTVYELAFGPIGAGLVLDHKCRIRCCCNPDHLDPVTHQINILRGTAPTARHAAKLFCDNGHSLHDAYLVSGARKCRACRKKADAAYYRRKKQGALLQMVREGKI